jgi:formylglycine-generating enzyme required for sulfatase activity
MSRIFLSHSSEDNFEAIAVRDWLAAEGWDDVFLDLDPNRGIAAGERWERALHKAASRCEAVVFLVSANWLKSGWCLKEYGLARKLNKKLFAVIVDSTTTLHNLPPELTDTWQVVDLAGGQNTKVVRVAEPGSHNEKHVTLSNEGLRRLKQGLEKAGLSPKFFAWPPEDERDRVPYRGFKPLEEVDAGIFFGRDAPILEAVERLRGLSAASPPRLLVILGASGAGKSSFLRAGILPRLARDDSHFIVLPVIRPERAVLFGESGLLHALEFGLADKTRAEIRAAIQAGGMGVRALLAELADNVSKTLSAAEERHSPPTVVMAIDQAEELFRVEGSAEASTLLELVREVTADDHPAVIVIFAIRTDSYDLLEHAKALEGLPQNTLALLPMPRGAYKDVIEGPARRFEEAGGKLEIEPQLTQRLLEEIDAGGGRDALPLLAFALEQLFEEYRSAGALHLRDYEAFGGLRGAINAAVERAFVRADADGRIPRERSAREALLRRGLIPWLVGVDPDTRSPRRNIARKEDIPAEAAPLIELLVDERLLATDVVTSKDSTTGKEIRTDTIEPTHEALLRQWGLLSGWLEEDFGLLATLEGAKRAARDWYANAQGEAWLAHRDRRLADIRALDARPDIKARFTAADRDYLTACFQLEANRIQMEASRRRGRLRTAAAITALVIGVMVLSVLLIAHKALYEQYFRFRKMGMHPLSSSGEQMLKPGDIFAECDLGCPKMVVIPAGSFMMGSAENADFKKEQPAHRVTIGAPIAVGKFDVTFAEWEVCVAAGACSEPPDKDKDPKKMGRNNRPVINVNLGEAKDVVNWLARMTGKRYRLLSEAEWEYAARAGTSTKYFWGEEVGTGHTVCQACGTEFDNKGTVPVGTFAPNPFGLYDMLGNVWQWVEDPPHPNYIGAPLDGSVWSEGGDTALQIIRGGGWDDESFKVRSAYRGEAGKRNAGNDLGFRVAREIDTGASAKH